MPFTPNSIAATSSKSISAAPSSRPTPTATWRSGRAARRSTCSAQGHAAGHRRPLRRRAQGVLRHRDLRLRDAARSRLGAVQQDHGRAVRHPDGRRAARPRPPPADAGVLVAAHRAAPGEHHRASSTACSTASRRTARDFDAHGGLRRASRRRCAADRHGRHGRAPQGGLHRVPRHHPGHHLRQAGRDLGAGAAAGVRPRHGGDQGHHRRAARDAARGLHQRSRQRARRRRQAQRPRAVRPDFRHLRRLAVGHQPCRRRCALSALHA